MPRTQKLRRFGRPASICLAPALALAVALTAAGCGSAAPSPVASPTLPVGSGATATATASATQAFSACAASTLQRLTEDQRVGQLFIFGVEGAHLSAPEADAIATGHLGSIWLVHWRTGGLAGIAPLAAEVQALATGAATGGVGFFLAADQEGGQVQRITGPGFSKIPTALEQGAMSPAALQDAATGWGRELKAAGVNLNFAPVMDVVPDGTDADNAPIGALAREFGHDPATAGSHGAAVVRGMAAAGVATTLKHFPGLGRVAANTDRAAGVVDSVTTANDAYLDSFRAGIAAGAPLVMVSLATYTQIDPNRIAAFSPAVIDLLRTGLGFKGVVVSDDLGSTASVASISAGTRAEDFIAAGGDLIVTQKASVVGAMVAAVSGRAASDAAFRALVDAAALQVLTAKAAFGLLACPV